MKPRSQRPGFRESNEPRPEHEISSDNNKSEKPDGEPIVEIAAQTGTLTKNDIDGGHDNG